jgi:uncharacterized membrane protein YfcA
MYAAIALLAFAVAIVLPVGLWLGGAAPANHFKPWMGRSLVGLFVLASLVALWLRRREARLRTLPPKDPPVT